MLDPEILTRLSTNDPTLVFLRFAPYQLNNADLIALAEALKTNTSLIELDLSQNITSSEGLKILAEALKTNTTLTILNLSKNHRLNEFGDSHSDIGVRTLAEALIVNTTLTELDLSFTSINDEEIGILAEALKRNTSLTKVNFDCPHIGSTIFKVLAEMLETNTTLTTLIYTHKPPDKLDHFVFEKKIENLIKRNEIIKNITKDLPQAGQKGHIGEIVALLERIKIRCPDIGTPDSPLPKELNEMYQEYINELNELTSPDRIVSPEIIKALIYGGLPVLMQKQLSEALVKGLFIIVSLPADVDKARYRMILWFLKDNPNSDEFQPIVRACVRALNPDNKDSRLDIGKHIPNQFASYAQLAKAAEDLKAEYYDKLTNSVKKGFEHRYKLLSTLVSRKDNEPVIAPHSARYLWSMQEIRTNLGLMPEDSPHFIDKDILCEYLTDQDILSSEMVSSASLNEESAQSILQEYKKIIEFYKYRKYENPRRVIEEMTKTLCDDLTQQAALYEEFNPSESNLKPEQSTVTHSAAAAAIISEEPTTSSSSSSSSNNKPQESSAMRDQRQGIFGFFYRLFSPRSEDSVKNDNNPKKP